jgi:hypothetical protein
MSESLVSLLVNLAATIASILAAVVAFFFSAQASLRGQGVPEIETLYRRLLTALLWILGGSVLSCLYFFCRLPWPNFSLLDGVFVALTALLLPATAAAFTVLFLKDKG